MRVCAHGNVIDYCDSHGLRIHENWHGRIEDYDGSCRVIVTNQSMSLQEFFYLKMTMSQKGYEVYSTEHELTEELSGILEHIESQERDRRKRTYGGRQPFGYQRRDGEVVENSAMMYVARRIIELRDSGMTLKEIQNFPEIHHPDGRKISVSTIQQIIKNRGRYGV